MIRKPKETNLASLLSYLPRLYLPWITLQIQDPLYLYSSYQPFWKVTYCRPIFFRFCIRVLLLSFFFLFQDLCLNCLFTKRYQTFPFSLDYGCSFLFLNSSLTTTLSSEIFMKPVYFIHRVLTTAESVHKE